MVFRHQEPQPRAARVVHGPFPVRVGMALAGVAALGFAVLVAAMALETEVVACRRGGECVVTHGSFSRTERARFPTEELRGTRVEMSVTRNKNTTTEWGVVVLQLARGEVRLHRVGSIRAQAFAVALDGARADGNRAAFSLELHDGRFMLGATAALALIGIGLLAAALRGGGRIHLDVDLTRQRLLVTRRVLGVPVTRHAISLAGVRDVAVELSEVRSKWAARGEGPRAIGRLVLVRDGGAREPVTTRLWPGSTTHLAAGVALRACLQCEPRSGHLEAQLAAVEPRHIHRGMRFGYAWLGMSCGVLVGMGLYGIVGLAVGAFRAGDTMSEWVPLIGGGGGALGGIALALYLSRPRVPR